MVVAVMRPAQRYREFVADLAPNRAVLGEPQVMGISRASPAHQAWLRCHELETVVGEHDERSGQPEEPVLAKRAWV